MEAGIGRLPLRREHERQPLAPQAEGSPMAALSAHQESTTKTSPTTLLFQHDLKRRLLQTCTGKSQLQEELGIARGFQSSVKLCKEEDGKPFILKEKLARAICCNEVQDDAPQKETNISICSQGVSTGSFLTEDDLLPLLKTCVKQKDLHGGCRVHANIIKQGLPEKHLFLHSAVVNLYAKCGAILRAREFFNGLPIRDVVLWNSLIAGYVHHRHTEEALECFDQMHLEGVFPDAVTFSSILKACGIAGLADRGEKIHGQIIENNLLEENTAVGNALIMMYAKCGLLEKAREVFDKLAIQDVVSWNSVITGYVQHGKDEEALIFFGRMKDAGFSPNAVTFVCVLKACGSVGAEVTIKEIQSDIMRESLLENNAALGTALIDSYASCGLFEKAEEALEKLPVRSTASWSALISRYVECGHCEEALRCFDQMQLEGFVPNGPVFSCILKACGILGLADKACEIHVQISKEGSLRNDIVVGNALIDMYAKCGLLESAQEVFNELPIRDRVSWNTLITGYAQHWHDGEALTCFEQMKHYGFFPDAVTFVCLLKACGSIGASGSGQNFHTEMTKEGLLDENIVIANALIDMYAKCGLLAEAQDIFDKLLVRDVISWSALIAGYARHMPGQEALNCFKQMQQEGFSPNAVTFLCILKACGSWGAANHGLELHMQIVKKGVAEKDMVVACALVDSYASSGMLAEAQNVFDRLPLQDVVSWNSLMAGFSLFGKYESVSNLFDKMVGQGMQPDLVTFTILLNTCSHGGLLEKGQMYFELMSTCKTIIPTVEHHSCMVDLFGRAGNLNKALAVIKEMPFFADLTTWHIILGACHKWGITELGRWAISHVANLDGNHASAYISMGNISAAYLYD